MSVCGGIPVNYQQRQPEKTTLYELVKNNYKTFLLEREEEGRTVAAYIPILALTYVHRTI
jgi:hypothetical protein